jgi:acetyl esterase/lipase
MENSREQREGSNTWGFLSLRALRSLRLTSFPVLVLLLFFGALFWAKGQDPFSRKWFTLKTTDHSSFKCVAILPKLLRQYPVIIYAHGSGGTLMNDGNDLRQMAELGLATVSLEYNQTNEATFAAQFEVLLRYLGHQKWVNTNAIAWVGFSLGANRMLDFALQHPERHPQLLVQLSGSGLDPSSIIHHPSSLFRCPVLLVHGEQDEVFPLADTKQLASVLQTNGLSVELKIIPGLPHGMEPERSVIFRSIGEYCLTHLAGKDAWQNYHSIARWQAEAPPLWLFWLPAAVVAAGVLARRRAGASRPADKTHERGMIIDNLLSFIKFRWVFRAAGRASSTSGETPDATLKRSEIMLRWLAVILATWALAETAIHLVTPRFYINDTTLSIARKFLVQPKEHADFENLASQSIWHNQRLKTLLEHVELAGYNRELINWQVDETNYQDFVLSPTIEPSTLNSLPGQSEATIGQPLTALNWRRPLWEEFYPRIRHESSPEDAAKIVVRHLRERVTIAALPDLPHDVSEIWLKQITDEAGFEIIYVAALRSVGVPARLDPHQRAEFWDGDKWRAAPPPSVISW